MSTEEIEKTLRWLETPGGENHPVGIKKDVAADIAKLARLGLSVRSATVDSLGMTDDGRCILVGSMSLFGERVAQLVKEYVTAKRVSA